MNYKTAEKLLDEKEENKKLLREAERNRLKEEYRNSIHFRVEQLINIVKRLGKVTNGVYRSHKLDTIEIQYDREYGYDILKIKSLEIVKKKWFLAKWEEHAWTRRISFDGRYPDDYSSRSYFYRDLISNGKLSDIESEKLLQLVEKEVFSHLIKTNGKKEDKIESVYCDQCGLALKKEQDDKFCPKCGHKFA